MRNELQFNGESSTSDPLNGEIQEQFICVNTQINGFFQSKFRILEYGDILRDCRKTPKIAILAISHIIKSVTYKHKIHRFRVFRQSLRLSVKYQKYIYAKKTQIFLDLKKYRYVGVKKGVMLASAAERFRGPTRWKAPQFADV